MAALPARHRRRSAHKVSSAFRRRHQFDFVVDFVDVRSFGAAFLASFSCRRDHPAYCLVE